MQTSQNHQIPNMFFNKSEQEDDSCDWPPIDVIDHYLLSLSDDGSDVVQFPVQNIDQYSNLDSTSTGTGSYLVQNSPSTASFSPISSPVSQPNYQSYPLNQSHSPDNTSSVAENEAVMLMVRQLEYALLSDEVESQSAVIPNAPNQTSLEEEKWRYLEQMRSRGDLKELLSTCAQAIEHNDIPATEWLIEQLREMVSVSGEPIQRLSAYALEGLIAKLASSGSSIYKALRCKEPASGDLYSYMTILFEVCPYFKFGYLSANGAIADAVKNEAYVHIVDFQICQGTQWMILIPALASRPGGPPRVRLTGIDDPTSAYARGGGMEIVGERLIQLAESCNVPFEFHPVAVSGPDIKPEDLCIQPGEALAVNFPLVLHHIPDESVGTENHRDRIIRLVKGLSPKVVTLIEQEANTNTSPFVPRCVEAINHYQAIFESVDIALARDHKERISVEQHCLAREIVNIIACEGPERVERHEPLGKWRSRFQMAGFTPFPLSSHVNATIKGLLAKYNERYTLKEEDGALYLGWRNQALISSSAWRC